MFNRIKDFLDRANAAFRNIGIIYGKMDYIYSELRSMKDTIAPFDKLAKVELAARERRKVLLAVSWHNGKLDHKWYTWREMRDWLGERYKEPMSYLDGHADIGEVVYIDGMLVTWVQTNSIQAESRRYQLT